MLDSVGGGGVLIGLGLAIKLGRGEGLGAPNKNGTKVFMAIGVLYGKNPILCMI